MRRPLALVVATLLCLAIAAPAAAAGPEKSRLDPTVLTVDDLAGTCVFPVELVDTFASSNEFIYPVRANGDQLLKYNGGFRSTLTNLQTSATHDISYFGRVEYLIRASGLIDVRTSGSVLYWVTGAETVSTFAPGIYVLTGSMRAQIDGATGLNTLPERFHGRITDVCAALS